MVIIFYVHALDIIAIYMYSAVKSNMPQNALVSTDFYCKKLQTISYIAFVLVTFIVIVNSSNACLTKYKWISSIVSSNTSTIHLNC